MVDRKKLINLLNNYQINGEKLINNNENVLKEADLKLAENIIIYLKSIGITPKSIEKCPSILWLQDLTTIKDNYNYLIKNTVLEHIDIANALSILSSDYLEIIKIYKKL